MLTLVIKNNTVSTFILLLKIYVYFNITENWSSNASLLGEYNKFDSIGRGFSILFKGIYTLFTLEVRFYLTYNSLISWFNTTSTSLIMHLFVSDQNDLFMMIKYIIFINISNDIHFIDCDSFILL